MVVYIEASGTKNLSLLVNTMNKMLAIQAAYTNNMHCVLGREVVALVWFVRFYDGYVVTIT